MREERRGLSSSCFRRGWRVRRGRYFARHSIDLPEAACKNWKNGGRMLISLPLPPKTNQKPPASLSLRCVRAAKRNPVRIGADPACLAPKDSWLGNNYRTASASTSTLHELELSFLRF